MRCPHLNYHNLFHTAMPRRLLTLAFLPRSYARRRPCPDPTAVSAAHLDLVRRVQETEPALCGSSARIYDQSAHESSSHRRPQLYFSHAEGKKAHGGFRLRLSVPCDPFCERLSRKSRKVQGFHADRGDRTDGLDQSAGIGHRDEDVM